MKTVLLCLAFEYYEICVDLMLWCFLPTSGFMSKFIWKWLSSWLPRKDVWFNKPLHSFDEYCEVLMILLWRGFSILLFEVKVPFSGCSGLGERRVLLFLLSEFLHLIEKGLFVVRQLLFVHQFYFNQYNMNHITEAIIGNMAEYSCSAPIYCFLVLTEICKIISPIYLIPSL